VVLGDGSFPYSAPFFLLPNRTSDAGVQGRFVFTGATGGQDVPLNTTDITDTSKWLRLSPRFQRFGYGHHWHRSRTTLFGASVLLFHLIVDDGHMNTRRKKDRMCPGTKLGKEMNAKIERGMGQQVTVPMEAQFSVGLTPKQDRGSAALAEMKRWPLIENRVVIEAVLRDKNSPIQNKRYMGSMGFMALSRERRGSTERKGGVPHSGAVQLSLKSVTRYCQFKTQ